MNARFDELSRKAATGTLTAPEREWLEAHLLEHPGQRADLEWDAAFSAQLEDKIAAMPALPGWERTTRVLQDEQAPSAITTTTREAKPSIVRGPGVLDRLSDWLASSLGFNLNAQAIAVALVVMQAGVIGLLAWQSPDTEHNQIRAGTQDPTPRGPLLRVSFRQDLREAELRRALTDVGAEIVGGPGQIGVYLLRIKEGDLAAAAQRLRASGTTELVEIVDGK
jgi:hypothetical protein